MNATIQQIDEFYDSLMFAKSLEAARAAAAQLVNAVLGEQAHSLSLEEALRKCCRILRPARDPKDQLRYEAEFLELAMAPNSLERRAA